MFISKLFRIEFFFDSKKKFFLSGFNNHLLLYSCKEDIKLR